MDNNIKLVIVNHLSHHYSDNAHQISDEVSYMVFPTQKFLQ